MRREGIQQDAEATITFGTEEEAIWGRREGGMTWLLLRGRMYLLAHASCLV